MPVLGVERNSQVVALAPMGNPYRGRYRAAREGWGVTAPAWYPRAPRLVRNQWDAGTVPNERGPSPVGKIRRLTPSSARGDINRSLN